MNNKKGFTLVEILVVIAIIGVLALLILPNVISSFTNASNRAMITQENEVVDAARLFVEDFCRNPLKQYDGQCKNYSVSTSQTNKKYTCISTLQSYGYLEDIISNGTTCSGFVIYASNFVDYKTYLYCGEGYSTSGINSFKDRNGNSLFEICVGEIAPTPDPDPDPDPGPNPPGPVTAQNYLNTYYNEYYETLDAAFNSAASNHTIRVMQNTTETTPATLTNDKTGVKLDLNGKTITANVANFITNSGTLDIYNTSSTEGKIIGNQSNVIINNTTLTLNGTASSNKTTIANNETTGNFTVVTNNNGGTLTLKNNSYVSMGQGANGSGIKNIGRLEITGGNVTGKGIRQEDGGTFSMSSGSINVNGTGILNYSNTNSPVSIDISGGEIICNVNDSFNTPIQNDYEGNIRITNGTLRGYNGIMNQYMGDVTINGSNVKIIGSNTGIINKSRMCGTSTMTGDLTIIGATIQGGTYGISMDSCNGSDSSKSKLTITSGSVTATGAMGTAIGITDTDLILGTNDGSINASSPLIDSKGTDTRFSFGIRDLSTGSHTISFYDGVIKSAAGTGTAITGTVKNTPSGYTVSKTTSSGVETAILALAPYQNTNTNAYYDSLKTAFENVANNQTIKVLQNVTESTSASLTGRSGVKLDLNGKTITMGNYNITNSGTLDIYNTSSTEGKITSSTNTIVNNGTLTTNGTSNANTISIISTGTTGSSVVITNNSGGTLTLNAKSKITASNSVANCPDDDSVHKAVISSYGTLTIAGATITNNGTLPCDCGIVNGKNLTMTAGSINTSHTGIWQAQDSTGTVNMSGGTITTGITSGNGINAANTATINVSGTAQINANIGINLSTTNKGNVTVSGGTITGNSYGIQTTSSNTGNLTITGGTISASDASALYIKGTGAVLVTGGTISSNSGHGINISSSSTVTLGTNDTTISTSSPVIEAKKTTGANGVKNNGGTFNYYDGLIKSSSGTGTAIDGTITNTPTMYEVKYSTTSGVESATLGIGRVHVIINGAKNETITISGGESTSVVTDSNSQATIDLYAGSYTFTSNVARSTTAFGTYYSKSITVPETPNATVNFYPDGALFWYGNGFGSGSLTTVSGGVQHCSPGYIAKQYDTSTCPSSPNANYSCVGYSSTDIAYHPTISMEMQDSNYGYAHSIYANGPTGNGIAMGDYNTLKASGRAYKDSSKSNCAVFDARLYAASNIGYWHSDPYKQAYFFDSFGYTSFSTNGTRSIVSVSGLSGKTIYPRMLSRGRGNGNGRCLIYIDLYALWRE